METRKEFFELFSPMGMTEAGCVIALNGVTSVRLNHVQESPNTKVYYMVLKDDAKTPKQRKTETRSGWLKPKGTVKGFKTDEKFIELHVSNQISSPYAEFYITRKV